MDYALGIDIGGTNTVFGLVGENGHVLAKKSILTVTQNPVQELLDRLFYDVSVWESEMSDEVKLVGIGIGVPNGNYHTGMINPNPPNLGTYWDSLDLVKTIKHYRDVPVIVSNDANAVAIGEMYFGAAKRMCDFVVITLGTGLGSGIVLNGNVIYGHDGSAGELGHIVIEKNGRKCKCGKSGCLEMYVSSKGLDLTVKEFKERNRQISSPALQLELERLAREVEVQKGIYLTLKQQFEMAKIEEVQETSIMRVLDKPRVDSDRHPLERLAISKMSNWGV